MSFYSSPTYVPEMHGTYGDEAKWNEMSISMSVNVPPATLIYPLIESREVFPKMALDIEPYVAPHAPLSIVWCSIVWCSIV